MVNCEYIFQCDYEERGKDPICKNNVVSCMCGYYQGLKAKEVRDRSGGVENLIKREEKSLILF